MITRETLIQKYPQILQNVHPEVDDGWCDLLDHLMSNLQWNTEKNGYPQVVATQIKEKFGTLRFYYQTMGVSEENNNIHKTGCIEGMISFAETMSGHICESCGEKGKVNKGGWLKCLCEKCNKRR